MKRYGSIFLLIAVFCVSMFLSGCATKKDSPDSKPLMKGGKINIGSTVEPDTWNPYLSDLMSVQEIGRLIFSGLLVLNDKGEWIPDLAQEVPRVSNNGMSADGLTVTYRLRPNVKWHDGTPLTARDVRFTYDFVMKNKARVPWGATYDKILSVETPDDLTVIVKFRERTPHFGYLFSFILPSHTGALPTDTSQQNFNSRPVGTGPFKLVNWRRGDSLEFEAYQGYHLGKPQLDAVSYHFVPDRQTVLSQLKIGEVDMVNNIGYDQVDSLRTFTGVNVFLVPGLILEQLVLNVENPLLNEARTRQAISLSLDRNALVEKTLRSVGFAAASDLPPMSWAADKNRKPAERNLQAAKDLLTQSGWRQGLDGVWVRDGKRLSITMAVPAKDVLREAVAQELARQMREAGVEIRVQPVDRKVLFDDILPNRKFEMVLFATVTTVDPDGIERWSSSQIPTKENRLQGKNFASWRNFEVDGLLEELAWTATRDRQREIYENIRMLLEKDAPAVFLYYRPEIAAAKRVIVNFKPNPAANNFWNAWEWGLRGQ